MDRLPTDRRAADLARAASKAERAVRTADIGEKYIGPKPEITKDPYAYRLRRCRVCGCEEVRCHFVTHDSRIRFLRGSTYDHACPRCGRTFRTESIWGSLFSGLSAVCLVALFGYATIFRNHDSVGARVLSAALAVAGVVVGVQTVRRIVERVANPVVR